MTDQIDDTVLGAYVDGELTADQASKVESFIAVNVEAMQMVRSIREITSLLRAAGWEGLSLSAEDRRLAS
jgi:anti-sigma factor RsiW